MLTIVLLIAALWLLVSVVVLACCVSAAQGEAGGWSDPGHRRRLRRPRPVAIGQPGRTRPVA